MSSKMVEERSKSLTQLLQAAVDGDKKAETRVCEVVYDELRNAANAAIRQCGSPSLQATDLVHELVLKLFLRKGLQRVPNRKYFFAVVLDQLRKILVDRHRKRHRLKAGGHFNRVPLDSVLDEFERENQCDVEALEKALQQLQKMNERQYQVVIHKSYGGLGNEETADLLGISKSSVERDWRLARAKLSRLILNDDQ